MSASCKAGRTVC